MLMAYRDLILLDFKVQKRRLWTSLDDELVGRGKLNCYYNLLILLLKKLFFIFMEYHLEYPFSE